MNLWRHSRVGGFEMEFQCLGKVLKRNMSRLTLACHIDLQGLCHEPIILSPGNRGDLYLLHGHAPNSPRFQG